MRSTVASVLLGLPLLAVAEEVPQYQAQFQNIMNQAQPYLDQVQPYWDQVRSYVPNPNKHDPVAAAEAKAGSMKLDILTQSNYDSVLRSGLTPESKTPEQWWVLITGGNSTCFGRCGKVEEAFNQTAARFALDPSAPHMALLDCDNQPVLCNAWSAPTGSVWIFEMLPRPAPVEIWAKRLNLTTTTAEDIAGLRDTYKETGKQHHGTFHPYDGPLAKYNISIPVGYILWIFSVIPSWAFMIGVSMLSRTMMSNRMQGQQGGGRRPAPTGQAVPR